MEASQSPSLASIPSVESSNSGGNTNTNDSKGKKKVKNATWSQNSTKARKPRKKSPVSCTINVYFDYCDVVWGDCSKTRADKLKKLQNRAARIITRADYSIRSFDVLNSLEWSTLEERRKRHLLETMFKIFNNDCPTYLREQFHRTSEIHDYNLRGSNYDLQLPLPKTNFLKRSFSYRGAMAWNQLSNETREMGDLTSFKLAIS